MSNTGLVNQSTCRWITASSLGLPGDINQDQNLCITHVATRSEAEVATRPCAELSAQPLALVCREH